MGSKYQDLIVEKPWGYEYLAYENEDVALWALHISHENMRPHSIAIQIKIQV